ncbi:MAG TPA: adenylate/guanylate cyclase domain-containing protein [Acidimicrobiales bacterium]|nr:adenylate/guanylate cyclase domain-containing protein [Acidimicrobiales bacterium]
MSGDITYDARRALWRRTWWRCLSYNLLGGGLCLVFFLRWLSPAAMDLAAPRTTFLFLGAFAVYVGVGGLITSRQDRTRTEIVMSWLAGGRHPNARGRQVVLDEPLRQAATSMIVWTGGCVVFASLYIALTGAVTRGLILLLGAMLGGIHVAAVVFLLCERGLRPLTALALEDGLPGGPSWLSVQRRLQVAWASGSGIPLLGIGVALIWQAFVGQMNMAGPLWALVVTGLLAGYLAITGAARAVSEPVSNVRAGLLRVQRGDLDVEVAIDDPSEVGLLQSGFNRMVGGLREARNLRDLFGRHVGTDVARQAVAHGFDFEGELCEVSILFVDVVGSVPLLERRAPREVMRMLNALFDRVVEVVEASGGWVNRFQGDAALCIFGAPVAMPDHADRALRAALELRTAIDGLRSSFPELDTGIGVSSGEAVTGYLGGASRYEFGIVGEPANEAARLSDEAKRRPSRVLASAATIAAVSDATEWTPSDRVHLRGKTVPSDVYEPTTTAERP